MKIKNWLISIFVMALAAMVMLLVLSVFTYIYKWQADKALLGITFTYILTGFVGGRIKRRLSKENNISKKLVEGIFLGVIFMAMLVVLSVVVAGNSFEVSNRFLMIGMLLVGSACLGRIL